MKCPKQADSETASTLVAARGREKGEWKLTTNGSGFGGMGDEMF